MYDILINIYKYLLIYNNFTLTKRKSGMLPLNIYKYIIFIIFLLSPNKIVLGSFMYI